MTDISEIWSQHRRYLVDLAFRMLGSIQDAEDVVQEAFSRLLTQQVDEIDDMRGWLVVVVSRLCLDQLRSAKSRRESQTASIDEVTPPPIATAPITTDPADRVTLDDSIRIALLVVLQQLSPAERAVFVLHDVFQFSFDAVGTIVGRTPAACRQLASRARRRIEAEAGPARFTADTVEQQRVTQRFIEACAGGDLDALLALLDADAVGDVDLGPLMPARAPLRGRAVVARNILGFFGPESGTTLVSHPVNGHPGLIAFRGGRLFSIVQLRTRDDVVHDLHAVADPQKLALLQLELEAATGA